METNNNNNSNSKNISLDSILARDDYKRMTAQLREKVEDIAHRIYKKMEELDIDEPIEVDGVTIERSSACANVGTYNYLAILDNDGDRSMPEEYQGRHSLEDIGRGYYYAGDFTAWVQGASNKEALAFLKAAKDFILALGEMEQKQTDNIQKAIKENEDI